MKGLVLLFLLSPAALATVIDDNKDLQPEETQRRIHDIIRLHEDYDYGRSKGGPAYAEDYAVKKHQPQVHPVAIKSLAGFKSRSYYNPPSPKAYDVRAYTLKPVSSKIYSYYPKFESQEQHSNKYPVVYYPVKDQQQLEEPKYDKYADGYAAYKDVPPAHEVYAAPVHGQSQEYPQEYKQAPHAPLVHQGYAPIAPQGGYPEHGVHSEHAYEAPVVPVTDTKYEEVHPPAPHYKNAPPVEYLQPVPRPKVYISKGPLVAHKDSGYGDHAFGHKESGYKHHGNEHHGDHGEEKVSKHHEHKDYDVKDHKSHSAQDAHHDEHSKYRNKGFYERDRGYHYEKAYAYDRIRAHHDIEKSRDSHEDYKAQHSQHGHQAKGSKDNHSYMYFNKADHHGGQGYGKHGHHLDKSGYFKKGYSAHIHPVSHANSGVAYNH